MKAVSVEIFQYWIAKGNQWKGNIDSFREFCKRLKKMFAIYKVHML